MSDNSWPEYVPMFGAVSRYYGARYAQDYKEDILMLLEKMEQWRRSKSIRDLKLMREHVCSDSQYFRWACYNWIMRAQHSRIMKKDKHALELVESLKLWADWFGVMWRPGLSHMKQRRPAYLVRREWEEASRW